MPGLWGDTKERETEWEPETSSLPFCFPLLIEEHYRCIRILNFSCTAQPGHDANAGFDCRFIDIECRRVHT